MGEFAAEQGEVVGPVVVDPTAPHQACQSSTRLELAINRLAGMRDHAHDVLVRFLSTLPARA